MAAMSNTGISRRGFVKAAGAAGILAAGAASMSATGEWLCEAQATDTQEEKVAYTYHQAHCGSMCPLKCTVRDGRLVLIQPNDMASERRYQTCCLKGLSEVQHVYGEGRIQTPLRRTGERGANEFESITWDTALDEIAAKIKEVQSAHGDNAVMVTNGAEADVDFLAPMLGACGQGNSGIDVGTGNGLDPSLGMGYGYAMTCPEARDWAKSKLVIISGSNFCESSLTTARCLYEAQEAGTRVVCIDPHFSTTAGKADEWIPIEVGTDAALFLGMVSYILDNKLYDADFIKRHTALPFLVDKKTGKLLRAKKAAVDEAGAELTGQKDIFYVNAGGKAVVYADAKTADVELTGSVKVDGAEAVSVFELLLDNQKQYTTKWAAELTGIDAATIESLAAEYAVGPSSLAVGWGGWDKISNADIGGHAVSVLVALTGNIGKEGTGVGVYVGGSYTGYSAALGSWALPETMVAGTNDVALYDLPSKENNVHAWIAVGDAYIQRMADCTTAEDWIKSLDLIVSADPYFTESAKWSDYILPLTTRFEYDEDYGNIKNGYSHIVLQEKIIEPLFEAKTDLWFTRELAKRLGRDAGLPATARERVDAILANSADPYVNSLTVEKLAEHQGVWPAAADIDSVKRVVTDLNFATLSGNIDLYYEGLLDFNQALPNWEAPLEAYKDNPDRAEKPFQLGATRTRFRIHNQFNDSAWLQELYVPTVDVNPVDVEGKDIQNGDVVVIKNDRGSFKVPVHLNEAIRPGSARIYEAATADYTAEGNLQSVTNATRLERGYELMCGPVAPYSDTIVSIEKA